MKAAGGFAGRVDAERLLLRRTLDAPLHFKPNQDRRPHTLRQKHRVTNSASYDVALRQHGNLTVVGQASLDGLSNAVQHMRRLIAAVRPG